MLMLLAFLVDQIQQRCCGLFRRLWRGLGTKAKLWEMLRSVFRELVTRAPTLELGEPRFLVGNFIQGITTMPYRV